VRILRECIEVSLVLSRRVEDPRFLKVQSFSPGNHLHVLRAYSADDVDRELRAWLAEAHGVGRQEHVKRPARRPLAAPATSGEQGRKPHGFLMVLERIMPGSAQAAEVVLSKGWGR
jgi:hypothetical protein